MKNLAYSKQADKRQGNTMANYVGTGEITFTGITFRVIRIESSIIVNESVLGWESK